MSLRIAMVTLPQSEMDYLLYRSQDDMPGNIFKWITYEIYIYI